MEYKFQAVYENKLHPCEIITRDNIVFVYPGDEVEHSGSMIPGTNLPFCPVVQFTGHYDEDGNPVYDGHKLKFGDAILIVRWNPRFSSFDLYFNCPGLPELSVLGWSKVGEMKIVGHVNIAEAM